MCDEFFAGAAEELFVGHVPVSECREGVVDVMKPDDCSECHPEKGTSSTIARVFEAAEEYPIANFALDMVRGPDRQRAFTTYRLPDIF